MTTFTFAHFQYSYQDISRDCVIKQSKHCLPAVEPGTAHGSRLSPQLSAQQLIYRRPSKQARTSTKVSPRCHEGCTTTFHSQTSLNLHQSFTRVSPLFCGSSFTTAAVAASAFSWVWVQSTLLADRERPFHTVFTIALLRTSKVEFQHELDENARWYEAAVHSNLDPVTKHWRHNKRKPISKNMASTL